MANNNNNKITTKYCCLLLLILEKFTGHSIGRNWRRYWLLESVVVICAFIISSSFPFSVFASFLSFDPRILLILKLISLDKILWYFCSKRAHFWSNTFLSSCTQRQMHLMGIAFRNIHVDMFVLNINTHFDACALFVKWRFGFLLQNKFGCTFDSVNLVARVKVSVG